MSAKKHRFFNIFSNVDVSASLDGVSSVLEVYPDSDLLIEASALEEAARTYLVEMKLSVVEDAIHEVDPEAYRLFVESWMDKEALSHDWQCLGEDFTCAYEKATGRPGKSPRKDSLQSWSKLINAR